MAAPKRRAVVEELVKGIGGRLEGFYFAFGDTDAYIIIDAPDSVGIIAASLAVNAAGAVSAKTTVLISAEEMDQATKKTVSYRPPGA